MHTSISLPLWLFLSVSFLCVVLIVFFLWCLIVKRQTKKKCNPSFDTQSNLLHSLFSKFPFPFLVFDTNNRCVYANSSAQTIWKSTINETIFELFADKNSCKQLPDRLQQVHSGKVVQLQTSYLVNEKLEHYIEIYAPLEFGGSQSGYMLSLIDITTQKEAELIIQASETKFHSIFNNSPDTISLVDLETGKYVDVNACFIKNTGLSRQEIVGKTRAELNVWASERERVAYEDKIRNEQSVQNFEMQWNIADGVRQFLVSSEIIELDGRKTILTISKDVEEIHQMQQELARSEKKFRTIFDASTDGIVILSLDNRFIDINDAFLKMTGCTKEELLGADAMNLIHPDYYAPMRVRHEQLLRDEVVNTIELEAVGKAKRGWIEMNSRLIEYSKEKVILSHVRDITERKQLSQQILKLIVETEENERRRLAYDLHDDVGPLLSSLNMYVSLLARRPELGKYSGEIDNIQVILKESIAAVRAISNNICPQVLKSYGLSEALKNFFETNRQLIEIEFKNEFDKIRFAEAIEITIYRIVKELLNNTIKYANASKCVLYVRNIENKIVICYSDNGCGFDWNKTLESNSKNLGLVSIINRIRSLNGTYVVETAPNAGFKFTITLKQ